MDSVNHIPPTEINLHTIWLVVQNVRRLHSTQTLPVCAQVKGLLTEWTSLFLLFFTCLHFNNSEGDENKEQTLTQILKAVCTEYMPTVQRRMCIPF